MFFSLTLLSCIPIPINKDYVVDRNFKEAIEFVLGHEGGYSNHPNDKGGATKYGVSLLFLKSQGMDLNADGIIDEQDIEGLTKENAHVIYYQRFWLKGHYDKINSIRSAKKILDMSVNMGVHQANVLAQRAINRMVQNRLVEDGILGKKSLKAINSINEQKYYSMLQEVSIDFYNQIVIKNPAYHVFLVGWLRRAKS